MKKIFLAFFALFIVEQSHAGFTSDLDSRVLDAFRCSSKNSMFLKDADFTVRVTKSNKKEGEIFFTGDAMVAWNVLKKPDQWEFYGKGSVVGDEFRISIIGVEDGSLDPDGTKE